MFSKRLKQLRKNKRITQKELAGILNIDRTSIGKYETKSVIPSPDLLIKIADYFHVTLDYLLCREAENICRPAKVCSPDFVELFEKIHGLPPDKQAAIKILLDIKSPRQPREHNKSTIQNA